MTRPNKALIEERFLESLKLWIEHAVPTGSFLLAVLENDLKEAMGRGDEGAIDNLPHIVAWLYDDAPSRCWGSPTRVRNWANKSGPDTHAAKRGGLLR